MSSTPTLDLRRVGLPVCLLEFKSALDRMDSGDVLEVLVEDPDVVEDFVNIIRHSQDRILRPRREGDHYRIQVGASRSLSS